MCFGGPYIGYLCTTQALIRKMPGRLVGATTDVDGKRCFVLTMQAREQHIRREKATSNICTAQGIMCLYVAAYLSLMGPKGLQEVNEASYANAHYLREQLLEMESFKPLYDGPFLNEFALRYEGEMDLADLRQAMLSFLLRQSNVLKKKSISLLPPSGSSLISLLTFNSMMFIPRTIAF